MVHNLGLSVNRLGLQEAPLRMKTLRQRYLALPGRLTRAARRLHLALPVAWPWREQFVAALMRLRALPPCLTTRGALTISQRETRPVLACPRRASGRAEALPAARGDPHPSASGQLTWSSAQHEAGACLPGQVRPAGKGQSVDSGLELVSQ